MAKTYQVNNLKLRHDKIRDKWQVITPGKRILEEFRFEKDAILFMQDCYDFLTEAGKKRKYGLA